MRTYTPDRWVLAEIKPTDDSSKSTYRVFAGWYGGFASGDSWKLSSSVVDVTDDGDCYIFENLSGSKYTCDKRTVGMSAYMSMTLDYLQRSYSTECSLTVISDDQLQDVLSSLKKPLTHNN